MAGVCINLKLTDPGARVAIARRVDAVVGINARLQDRLRRQIRLGFDNGESVEQIAKRLRREFAASRARSATIARTEINGAAADGLEAQSVKTYGTNYISEWSSSRDGSVRESHQRVDGQRRKAGERFSNGLTRPHEPGAPAEEVINCRCTRLILPLAPK